MLTLQQHQTTRGYWQYISEQLFIIYCEHISWKCCVLYGDSQMSYILLCQTVLNTYEFSHGKLKLTFSRHNLISRDGLTLIISAGKT